jgi:O-antigen/teichoic acid export membrane protein
MAGLLHSRFARNWLSLVASNLLGQVLGIVATIRLARVLAPHGFGQYNLVQTVASLGTVFALLGFRNVVIRECARQPEKSSNLFWVSSIVRLPALIVTGIGVLVISQMGHAGLSLSFAAIVVGLMVGLSVWDLVEIIAFGHEQMEYSAGINVAGSLAWVGLVWAAPVVWLSPFTVILAFALLQIGKAMVYVGLAARAGYFQGRIQVTSWYSSAKSLLQQSLPFYWLSILTAATTQLPILFLAGRSGQAEVGLFNAGYRLINPLLLLVTTALTSLYPGLARAGASNDEWFMLTVRRAFWGINLLGTVGFLVVSLLRKEIILCLFGVAYKAAADAMAFQCWYCLLFANFALIGNVLAARDRQRWLAGLSTCYVLLSTPILWWGAGHGATGLAVAMLGAAGINMSYHWIVFQRILPWPLSLSFAFRAALTLGGGIAAAWAIPQSWPWLGRLVLSVVALAATLAGMMWKGRQRWAHKPQATT